MTPEKTPLERAAERSEADPFYMASALAAYRRSEGMDALAVAEVLGCAPADLPLLALCRKPGAVGEGEFGADVAHLVRRFGLNRAALVRVLRQEKFLLAAAVPPAAVTFRTNARPPMLLAAQDRLDEDTETDESLEDKESEGGSVENGDDGRLAG
jgi:hypothetical protein